MCDIFKGNGERCHIMFEGGTCQVKIWHHHWQPHSCFCRFFFFNWNLIPIPIPILPLSTNSFSLVRFGIPLLSSNYLFILYIIPTITSLFVFHSPHSCSLTM